MLKDYLRFGDVELINSARAKGYMESASCPLAWQKCDCDGLYDATGPGNFDISNIEDAPWYDPRNPESARFYGVTGLGLRDIANSTLQRSVTEGITNGGVAGSPRLAGKTVRVRAFLSADGEDGLEYGMAWLRAAVQSRHCNQHGISCGGADTHFFNSCPPERAIVTEVNEEGQEMTRPETDEEYFPKVAAVTRVLHGVSTISGPLEVQTYESKDGRHWGREVEFTLYAEQPGIYSLPRNLGVLVSPGLIVDDVVRNLIPYPSAELGGAETLMATNFVTNPSLESDGKNWKGGIFSGHDNPSAPAVGSTTGGVVTGDRAYVGRSAFRARWAGDGRTAGNGSRGLKIYMTEQMPGGLVAGQQVTVTVWGALISAGGGSLGAVALSANFIWLDASNGIVGSGISLGSTTTERDGKVFSITSQVVPAGATGIEIQIASDSFSVQSSPDPALNSDFRLYADAAGVIKEG